MTIKIPVFSLWPWSNDRTTGEVSGPLKATGFFLSGALAFYANPANIFDVFYNGHRLMNDHIEINWTCQITDSSKAII